MGLHVRAAGDLTSTSFSNWLLVQCCKWSKGQRRSLLLSVGQHLEEVVGKMGAVSEWALEIIWASSVDLKEHTEALEGAWLLGYLVNWGWSRSPSESISVDIGPCRCCGSQVAAPPGPLEALRSGGLRASEGF